MSDLLSWRFWLACFLVSFAWHLARVVERVTYDEWWHEAGGYLVFFLLVRVAADLFVYRKAANE